MPAYPGLFRLAFLLPTGANTDSGSHQPSPEGCLLHLTPPLAEIVGPSRDAVFEHATRFLRVTCRGQPPLSIAAQLQTPARPVGRDSWCIIVGADVSFSPTGLDPHLPHLPRRPPGQPPPSLAMVGGRGGA